MTDKERRERLEERRKNRKPSVAYATSDIAWPYSPTEDEEDLGPWFYYQVATTIGLDWKFNHPNIEAMITFHCNQGGYSVLRQLGERIE
mgnify:CR=1 FL=1